MAFKHKTYKISSLHLDIANPRMRRAANETEAQEKLLEGYGDTIVKLGRDIAKYGLSPLDQWAVVREGNKLIVLEGNRRLTACRLLIDSAKTQNASVSRRFEHIRVEVPEDRFMEASCVLFDQRADARHWIQIKHHGASDGAGVAQWGPEMTYLNKRNNGDRRVVWNELWIMLEDAYAKDADFMDTLEAARSEQYTLLERLVTNGLLDYLGLAWSQDTFEGMLGIRQTERMKLIFKDMSAPNPVLNSRTINSNKDASDALERYHDRVADLDVEDIDQDQNDDESRPSSGKPSPDGNSGDADPADEETEDRADKTPPRKGRKSTKLLKGANFNGFSGRIPKLAREAQELNMNSQAELCGVMLRVLLELATKEYISVILGNGKPNKGSLAKQVLTVIRDLDPDIEKQDPQRPELSGIFSLVRTDLHDSGKFTIDLNNFVHNTQSSGGSTIVHDFSGNAIALFSAMSTKIHAARKSGGREEQNRPE